MRENGKDPDLNLSVDATTSEARVLNHSKEIRISLEISERSGFLSVSINGKSLVLVRDDRRLTIRTMAEETGISCRSCQAVLTGLGVRRVSAKFVPRI